MTRMWTLLLFFTAGLSAPATAATVTPLAPAGTARTDGGRILARVADASEELRPQVATIIIDEQRRLGGCTDLKRLDAEEVWVLDDVTFFDSGKPMRGRWQIRYSANLCGQTAVKNVIFTAGDNGIALEALPPGTTLTGPELAADVWRTMYKTIVSAVPTCTTPLLKETQILERPAHANGIWREVWMARACDRDVAQVVSFYPSRAGTLFRMAKPDKPVGALVSRSVP